MRKTLKTSVKRVTLKNVFVVFKIHLRILVKIVIVMISCRLNLWLLELPYQLTTGHNPHIMHTSPYRRNDIPRNSTLWRYFFRTKSSGQFCQCTDDRWQMKCVCIFVQLYNSNFNLLNIHSIPVQNIVHLKSCVMLISDPYSYCVNITRKQISWFKINPHLNNTSLALLLIIIITLV